MPFFYRLRRQGIRPGRGHRGQTLVEYALILAFISIVAILALTSLGGSVKTIYSAINSRITSAADYKG